VTQARLTSATSDPRRTITASVALASLLRGPHLTGRLLGASPVAIYLRFNSMEPPGVVALLPPSSVRLPLGMVVSATLPALTAHEPVAVGEGALSLGDEVWVPSGWFDPRPKALTAADPSRVIAASSVLSELSAAEVGVDPERARAAVTALIGGEAEPACGLLGEGPGLTPAGDDVIAGALAACALLRGETQLRGVSEILAGARRATTSLSADLLSCAAAGQVVPEAADFLGALCGQGDVAVALAGLRSVGSTSGAALAVGIVAALDPDVRNTHEAHAGGAQ
jgi:hypothetical protein